MEHLRYFLHRSIIVLTGFFLLIVGETQAWAVESVFIKTYNAPTSGAPVLETDSFTANSPSGDYWLKVTNGSGSEHRVAQGYISINGAEQIAIDDSSQPAGTIRKKITLQNTNTIEVQLHAAADGYLTVQIFPVRQCGDVVVAGPWTFQPSAVNEVSFPVDTTELPGPCFIRIYNGASDGSKRVFSADVEFNGRPITDHMEISLMIGFFKEKITVADNNTLTVQVSGTSERYITIDIVTEYVAAGPWHITSKDLPYTDDFAFSAFDPANPYRLCIINGHEDGTGRVMQGWVKLNGEYIANQMSFMQAIRLREWNVNLSEDNLLEIWCGDGPGSVMTIYIFGEDTTAPAIQITYPADGSSNKTGFTDVWGTVDDAKAIVMVNNLPATLRDGTTFFVKDVPLQLPGGEPTPITATATDWCENSASDSVTVTLVPLTVEITSPQDGEAFLGRTVTVTGTVSRPLATVSVNEIEVEVDEDGNFTLENLPIVSGGNTITATATHLGEDAAHSIRVTGIPLGITIESPSDGQTFSGSPITITGTVTHIGAVVTVNGNPASSGMNGTTFIAENIALTPGTDNPIVAEATIYGEHASNSINVNYLTISITDPVDGQEFTDQPITVSGTVSIPGAAVTVNGAAAALNGNVFTAVGVPLTVDGDNPISAVATHNGVSAQDGVVVTYNANDPPVAVGDSYEMVENTALTVAVPGVLGNDTDPNDDALLAILEDNPSHGTVDLEADGSFTYTPEQNFEGTDSFTYWASDGNEESSSVVVQIVVRTSAVDLEAVSLDASGTYVDPQTLEISGRVVVEVRNNGPGDIAQEYALVVFEDLNANQAYDVDEENIFQTVPLSGGLAQGVSRIETVEVGGSVLFVGTLIHAFVDCNNVIEEIDEKNNITHSMADCEYHPPVGEFDPVLEWAWTSSEVMSSYVNVASTPAVGDLNGDGVPDVVFGAAKDSLKSYGVLRALDGDTGDELFTVIDSSLRVNTSFSVALGDIDLDGKPEIIAGSGDTNRLLCFEHDGSFKWRSSRTEVSLSWGAVTLSDLEGDGIPEIIYGRQVFNNNGTVRWTGKGGRAYIYGGISVIADLDLDGIKEVIAGNTAYRSNGALYWEKSLEDGYNAVGNFDDDPFPEIVLVEEGGYISLHEHNGGPYKWRVSHPGRKGGAPTVADFDGDGELEIGVAGNSCYAVFKGDGTTLWTMPTKDYSSGTTGSSVFDFEGDGCAEVVYSDEDKLYIYRGTDGAVLFETDLSSGTMTEFPIVVDVDNDGNAEIVAGANAQSHWGSEKGLYVFGDANDTWVNTRTIWNQHAYSITNVEEDGTISQYPARNWEVFNNFRCNQALDARACVDISASFIRIGNVEFPNSVDFVARIGNSGAVRVGDEVSVAFYQGDPQNGGILLGTSETRTRLYPGEYEDVVFTWEDAATVVCEVYVVADDDGMGTGTVRESNEQNNSHGTWLNFGNFPPGITSVPETSGEIDTQYVYYVEATDFDQNPITYILQEAPAGMSIDEQTGLITWIPVFDQYGKNEVAVQVSDDRGGVGRQEFTIWVFDPYNRDPMIASAAVTAATKNEPYSYGVEAEDPDENQVLTFSLVTAPEEMSIEETTGLITWVPGDDQIGNNDVQVAVFDNRGGSARQSYAIFVDDPDNLPPSITSEPVNGANLNKEYTYQAEAEDPENDLITFRLEMNPQGMNIDELTGLITWTPVETQLGQHEVEIQATDWWGNSGFQVFTIAVIDPDNLSPTITSTPVTTGEEEVQYTYDVNAQDPEDNVLTYCLPTAPAGMSIDKATGLITWTPDCLQGGVQYPILVKVSDNRGGFDTQEFTLTVIDTINNPPAFTSTHIKTVNLGEIYQYDVEAVDPEDDPITFTLVSGPDGMIIDESSGVMSWPDDGNRLNHEAIVLTVRDNHGNAVTDTWQIEIVNTDTKPPTVSVSHVPQSANVGDVVTFTVTAADDVDLDEERVWLQVDGVYVDLDNGQAVYTAVMAGDVPAWATAYDMAGNFAEAFDSVPVTIEGTDNTPPVAEITAPLEGAEVLSQADVIGTATDDNFAYYTLSYGLYSAGVEVDYIEYYRSATPIAEGNLGIIDATLLENGLYLIRLDVYDQYGNVSADEVHIAVDGNMKVGIFTLSFSDMSVMVPGLSLEMIRTYDSRVKTKGDFGVGWNLDIKKAVSLHEANLPGKGWELKCVQSNPYTGCTQYGLNPLIDHTITIHLPGAKQEFAVQAVDVFQLSTGAQGRFVFTPLPGTYSTLEAIDNVTFDYMFGSDVYYDTDDPEPINPNRYKLTLMDGTAFYIDQNTGGVYKIEDLNGNSLVIEEDGVVHSVGEAVTLNRDGEDRITSIVDGDDRTVSYTYDGHGNLQTVRDAQGYVTRFKYGPNHYLEEIIDPRGVRATRTEYDEDGRMVKQIGPDGREMDLNHNLADNEETVTDFAGRTTRYIYDGRGNVITKTDAAGNIWTYEYDSRDHLIKTINPDLAYTESVYQKDREVYFKDELGRETTRTFSNKGRVLTETDPLGRTTHYSYDGQGNVRTITGPDNTVLLSDNYGWHDYVLTWVKKSSTDALGNTTTYHYDPAAKPWGETDPEGHRSWTVYDRAGKLRSQTDARGNKTSYTYDANGNMLIETDILGNVTSNVYTSFGEIATSTDKNGNVTVYQYNLFGKLVKTINPDGTSTSRTYDLVGNLKTITDETGRTTIFEYDHEDRIVKTISHDGTYTETEYDVLGRVKYQWDAKRNMTEYAYDAAGNNTFVWDAARNVTEYQYDDGNRRTHMMDALTHTTEFEYNEYYDWLERTIYHDGTFTQTEYDILGRKTVERDQEGKVTKFQYDKVGNLVKVTDAMLFETDYGYDGNNNRIWQEDANNHRTNMAYDELNRLITKTYHNGDAERFVYDPNGNLAQRTTDNGPRTIYRYDSRNREVYREYAGGHTVVTTYYDDGKPHTVTDHRGTTVYEYNDCCGRLKKVTNPDVTFIEYQYDDAGNKLSMKTPWGTTEYTYDSLDRMKQAIAGEDITEYFYDAVGNRDYMTLPNGCSVDYEYDDLNWLTKVTNYALGGAEISSYEYVLNNAGIRTAVIENGGAAQVDYGYDDLYRLASETRTGTNAYARSYTYDAVGNRLTATDNGQLITTYSYNDRDQLETETKATETTIYTYDAAGRQESKTDSTGLTVYTWVDNDRLASVNGEHLTVNYQYDADGNKVGMIEGTETSNYLIDTMQPYAQVIAETDGTGALAVEYVFGLDRISQERDGSTSLYLADGQGSIRELVDEAGQVANEYDYYAFGELLNQTGTIENDYKYVGEEHDPNSGYYYLRARWMDPARGRFMSVDPWGGDPQAPVSLHRYLYANMNPVTFVDPSGYSPLMEQVQTIAIAAVLTSIAVPTLKGLRGMFSEGNTDYFELSYYSGAAGGAIVYGGVFHAIIWERECKSCGYSGRKSGYFEILMIGVGAGITFTLASEPVEFWTIGTRRIEDFQGFGNISVAEAGKLGVTRGIYQTHLPDGTIIPRSWGSGFSYGSFGNVYTVLAYWRLDRPIETVW